MMYKTMIAVHVDVGPIEMVVRKKFHKLTISIVISINPPPPPLYHGGGMNLRVSPREYTTLISWEGIDMSTKQKCCHFRVVCQHFCPSLYVTCNAGPSFNYVKHGSLFGKWNCFPLTTIQFLN